MCVIQILLGGITRLTDSGLSITEWNLLQGAVPPLSESAWQESFEKYKEIGQYQLVNEGMTLGEYKAIFLWEYMHRLWGRLIGVVFAIPLFFFFRKKWIPKALNKHLIAIVLLGIAQAAMGWIMVKSGLVVDKTYVNPYKLTVHLILALALLAYLWMLYLAMKDEAPSNTTFPSGGIIKLLLLILLVQICLGGFVAGMRAARIFNDWPTMGGEFIPALLMEGKSWSVQNFNNYDSHPFAPVLMQWIHRLVAYVFTILLTVQVVRYFKRSAAYEKNILLSMIGLVLLQVVLGIITLLVTGDNAGKIPIFWAAAHQIIAFILMLALLQYHHRASLKSIQ